MENSTSQRDSVTEDEMANALASSTEEPATDTEVVDGQQQAKNDEPGLSGDDTEKEPDSFDRAYVEKLRQENGKYRQRAQRADELAHRLHRALVEATGRLADPTDLPFDENHLGDTESLTSAIDELLTAKPHLAARRVTGDVGQGALSSTGVDLAAIMRGHT